MHRYFCCCSQPTLYLQALLLGKPGGQCGEVPNAQHWTFAELEGQVGERALHAKALIMASRHCSTACLKG
jgi:hypothetical protein